MASPEGVPRPEDVTQGAAAPVVETDDPKEASDSDEQRSISTQQNKLGNAETSTTPVSVRGERSADSARRASPIEGPAVDSPASAASAPHERQMKEALTELQSDESAEPTLAAERGAEIIASTAASPPDAGAETPSHATKAAVTLPSDDKRPRPNITPLPRESGGPEVDNSWTDSYAALRNVTQKLARIGGWKQVAAVTSQALLEADYAVGTTCAAMLLDLARIYRDRLSDAPRATETFAALAAEDPANREALDYLTEVYQREEKWRSSYDLCLAAVEATWDPHERLEWTRSADDLAREKLGQIDLAIKAWEHLWELGDAQEEASHELLRYYRLAGRWKQMAAFLSQRAEELSGAAQLVALRELAEVKLSGQEDADGASAVLEKIVARSPNDPIATLQLGRVYAARRDWTALEQLATKAASDEAASEALDLQQLVADALWRVNRLEPAVEAYDRILLLDPTNHDAIRRKREFLTKKKKYRELLDVLVQRASAARVSAEQASLLAEAAKLAEHQLADPAEAARLWHERLKTSVGTMESHVALARLYGQLRNQKGLARALEGQLELTKAGKQRIELLRKLGAHYAGPLSDDDSAERCWKEILLLDPSDLPAREQLVDLHRRRKHFDALDAALMRQIWLTHDPARALHLSRIAAENIDGNFADHTRSVEAWRRVLDYAPEDQPALESLAGHYSALDQRRELIAALEQRIRCQADSEQRIALALQVADIWAALSQPRAAAATYERVLRWDAVNATALEELTKIYCEADQLPRALGMLENASALASGVENRIKLLERSLTFITSKQARARFFLWRRILFLGGETEARTSMLRKEAETDQSLWPEMARGYRPPRARANRGKEPHPTRAWSRQTIRTRAGSPGAGIHHPSERTTITAHQPGAPRRPQPA